MSILLALILVSNLVFLALFASFLFRLSRVHAQFVAFVSPEGENQPSPLGKMLDIVAADFARAAVAQIKAHLMGAKGVDTRQANAIEGDIALDVAGQNPLIGQLLERMPNLKRTLRRNPALINLVIEKLPGMFGLSGQPPNGPVAAQPGNGNRHSQAKFKL